MMRAFGYLQIKARQPWALKVPRTAASGAAAPATRR